MTEPVQSPVAVTRSSEPVAQSGPVGQDREVAAGLKLQGVGFALGQCRVAGITVQIGPGEVVGLVGPVGAGKTTLIRAIAGVQPISAGHISIGGREMTSVPPEERNLGWVPQGGGLLPALCVADQIAFPLQARGESISNVESATSEWGLNDLLRSRPEQLSGGEQQLVALARAIVRRPVGLLLDEPFAALSREQRLRAIERLATWRTKTEANVPQPWIIHSTHRIDEVANATQIWRIEDGRLHVESVD